MLAFRCALFVSNLFKDIVQGVQKAGKVDDSLYNHPMTGNDKWDAIQEGGGICKLLRGKVPP